MIFAKLFVFLLIFAEITAEAAKITLTWTAPTYNTDGTALTNLTGYMILFRKKGNTTWLYRRVTNPAATTFTIWNLDPVVWQVCIKTINNVEVRSMPTGIVEGLAT